MAAELAPELITKRIALLTEFGRRLREWAGLERDLRFKTTAFAASGASPQTRKDAEIQADARSFLNRNMLAVRSAVSEAGLPTTLIHEQAPMLGGRRTVVDAFSVNLFNPNDSPVPLVLDLIEQAIGNYEHMRDGTGLVSVVQRDALDVIEALLRGIRPAFDEPPANEKAVQKAAETILCALGTKISREKESATIGDRNFIPDFVLTDLDMALEFKLANEKHSPAKVQDEIASDVATYKTKWKHVVFIVYDCGQISTPDRFRDAHRDKFGVQVHIIKH